MDAVVSQTNTFTITPLSGALGARVENIDVRRVDDAAMKSLREAFLQHHVLVFPGQGHITPEEHIAFGAKWGELHLMPTDKRCLNGNRHMLVLDWEDQRPATDMWHSDVSMDECPPLGSLLLARTVPTGGDTIFANQHLAYEALSDGLKRTLDGLKAMHTGDIYGKAGGGDPAILPRNLHPVVRTHPETGRKALYVNEIYTTQFEGWTVEESAPLLRWLYAHASQPNFTFRHRWTVGDMLVWDNRSVQHFAVWDYGKARRTMHRVTILGDRPR